MFLLSLDRNEYHNHTPKGLCTSFNNRRIRVKQSTGSTVFLPSCQSSWRVPCTSYPVLCTLSFCVSWQAQFVELDPWVVAQVLRPNLDSCSLGASSLVHTARVETFLQRAAQYGGMHQAQKTLKPLHGTYLELIWNLPVTYMELTWEVQRDAARNNRAVRLSLDFDFYDLWCAIRVLFWGFLGVLCFPPRPFFSPFITIPPCIPQ